MLETFQSVRCCSINIQNDSEYWKLLYSVQSLKTSSGFLFSGVYQHHYGRRNGVKWNIYHTNNSSLREQ